MRLKGRAASRRANALPDATVPLARDDSFSDMVHRIEESDAGRSEPITEAPVAVGGFDPGEMRDHATFEADAASDGRLLPALLVLLFVAFVALIWLGFQVIGEREVEDPIASDSGPQVTAVTTVPVTGSETSPETTVAVSVPMSDEEILAAVQTGLEAGGYSTVTASLEDGSVVLDGVVPLDVLEDGFFAFADGARDVALQVPGVESVNSRLRLKGDPVVLRDALRAITDEGTIVFASGSSDLSPGSVDALDRVAQEINAQPGLIVLIAGHADPAGSAELNEQLARARAASVYGYLVSKGVAPNRLSIVSYGELFPDSEADAAAQRRIEFEVGL